MTKGILAEQIRRKLAGGTPPPDFHITPQEVEKYVDQVANAVIAINCLKGMIDDYTSVFEDLAIVKDSKKNLYYTTLPALPISLPNQAGIFQVSTMQDQSIIFTATPSISQWLSGDGLNEDLQGEVGYYNDGNKLWFVNYNPTINTDTILVKMVIDRSYFGFEDDYLVMPNDEDIIVNGVMVKYFSGK